MPQTTATGFFERSTCSQLRSVADHLGVQKHSRLSKAGLINAITAAMIDVLIDREIRDFFNGDGLQFNENELKVIAFALGDTYYQQDTKSTLVEVIKQCIESDYVIINDDVTQR